MNELTVFENSKFGQVRVIDRDGDPWFVAKDVADILGYEKPSKMYARLDDDEKLTLQIGASGQMREMIIISESGLYNAIIGSHKPEAKEFKKWVTSEVLPTIRKTGSYSVQNLSTAEYLLQQAHLMVEIERQSKQALQIAMEQKERLDQIETAHNYFTVIGYANIHKKSLSLSEAKFLGKRAAKYCKANSVVMDDTPDPRFGRINTYPKWVLDIIFERDGR